MTFGRGWAVCTAVGIAVGAVLRIRQVAVNRSLWVDEALLAQNVVERGMGELLEPLAGQQGAPVGYLWVLRALVLTVGSEEVWLRLPSLVAGIVLLPLVALLARRLASPAVAAAAVWLVATSPGLIRYSAELKQYAIDAAVAVLLVLLAARVDQRRPRTMVPLALVGAVVIWLSHASVLVLCGVGLVLLVRAARGGRRAVVPVLGVGGAWAGVLAVVYLVSLRQLTENDFLTSYWQAGFPDDPLVPHRLLRWGWDSTVALLDDLGGFALAALAAAGATAGAVALVRARRWTALALLVAPAPALVLAASLELYPYRGRLALFALPLLLVVLACTLLQRTHRGRLLAAAGLALLAVAPAIDSGRSFLDPAPSPQARQVVEHVARHHRPAQQVVLPDIAAGPFAYYGARDDLERSAALVWRAPGDCPTGGGPAQLRGEVWVVFAYTHSAMPPDEAEILRSHLDPHGHLVELVEAHDAFAARYDFDAPPDDPTGAAVRVTPRTGCLALRPG